MKKEDTASYTAYQLVDFSQTSPSPRPSLDISQTGNKEVLFFQWVVWGLKEIF